MGLEMVDLVLGAKDAFGVAISYEDAERLDTVGKFYEYMLRRLQTKSGSGTCLTSSALRVDPQKVTEEANFVADLGAG